MNFERPQMNREAVNDDFIQRSLEELRQHDRRTYEHSIEIGAMASYIAREAERILSEKERPILLQAALLHDYGKIGVESEILNKESDLSDEERKKIQMHPKIGFDELKRWNMDVAKVIVAHHEYQKNSYPRESASDDVWEKRSGDSQTRRLSRILAMIDSFQAMLADRPGKNNKPKAIDQAIAELQRRFILPGDQEIIMLLESYYRQKNPHEKVDYSKYINLVGNA